MRVLFAMLLLVGFAVSAAEPTQTFTDDLNRKVVVPVHPKRIVSLHDLDITIPLIELGVPPVASHGRTRPDGSHFLRSSGMLTGVDFDNSDIKFIGTADIDMEAIAAAKPDLIITEPTRNTPARLKVLERRYQEQIKALKATIDTRKITVSVIQANQGKINAMHSYHSLGRVLRDAGFTFPPLIESIPEGGRIDVSAERLPELDADFVFATWRGDTGGKPQDELAAMDAVMPGWCQFLNACRTGHYVLISREEAISNSFASLGLMAAQVQSQIAGRPLPEASR
ncbi:ABC transporter substrate-binding protein [Enterobacter kobei]|uniref:ABC transporter substrate-binding protein n=1 Tax=Enterobacter kobei TaxID=208224 RepID=UPI001257F42C|nr:ABC transporter substrate-binding protein [Enterobacter kobei]VAX71505.1 ABC transporter periplasmic protein [Enterobacter kobei]